jgi:hypothetical protein
VPGQLTQTNGNPWNAGTLLSGPILAGTIQGSDGTNTLGGVGETQGTANVGFCVMAKSCVITQATNVSTTGQFVCPIVIPAQSQILAIYLMVTAAWTSTTTLGIGTNASATAFTTSAAVSGATLGQVIVSPGTSGTQIANWDNVGTTDVQIVVLSGSTGTGAGTLTVVYIQGNDMAS